MYEAFEPLMRLNRAMFGTITLEQMLLGRHLLIDELLKRAIESGRVGQVVEIAGGMSGRGIRFSKLYGERGCMYLEGDLPGMAERKRRVLSGAGLGHRGHRVVDVDALAVEGRLSIQEAMGEYLDKSHGTAVVIEGLLSYLRPEDMARVLGNVCGMLKTFGGGVFLSDAYLSSRVEQIPGWFWFQRALGAFVRGRTYLHFRTESDAVSALTSHGFERAVLHEPAGSGSKPIPVHIVEAWV